MKSKLQKFYESIKGKRIALCGIGVSNTPLALMFAQKGALVTVCDRRSKEQLGQVAEELEAKGIALKLGENYLKDIEADIIFRTPGMQYYLPELCEYRRRGVAVTSEMEVFFELCPAKIIAVTGSNGKTTTTTIISELLLAKGERVWLGGNIGRALLPLIEEMSENDFAVVELSSFQLISMRTSPDIAVVTNLSPNHLDMHKDMNEYIDSKKNIFLHQNAFSRTVLNLDNEITAGFADDVRGDLFTFSRKKEPERGAFADEKGDIYFNTGKQRIFVLSSDNIKIPGNHNVENYLAAISATWGYVGIEDIRKVAADFGGVEHRAELVRELKGVRYYNDSIATTPSRTMQGTLSLYEDKIILIAGGYDKKIPFDSFGNALAQKVKLLILMGVTADKIEQSVKSAADYTLGSPEIIRVNSMAEAVQAANKYAAKGDVVSLSPACASFDMYPNFEARGKDFKQLVNGL
ncbi:MAG: UDP-N-acetylmuramoyl-L-alanine--D-glutamate ligase [Oscillospiraceae bacterium]|jgi:UDP-N-acetylmuramoylalanine--D-glutamate ligase|nr:UDP-N-acetylmuramoyl-L-alanine--D-glutamate ligase [Oscillospiraceae bacterium]